MCHGATLFHQNTEMSTLGKSLTRLDIPDHAKWATFSSVSDLFDLSKPTNQERISINGRLQLSNEGKSRLVLNIGRIGFSDISVVWLVREHI